nr:ATP-binding protein [Nostoc sp. ChiSLP03a]MDZ8213739.1 ATP-binding protein [Nostoc sp. ChiSLP03a]
MAHRSTLVQVVTNILSNAMKFVQPGIQPKVEIYAEEQQDSIQLSIVDNGIGIAPEHQERIFRVFERLHGVEIYPGTGIGLAIVRKGLERMGGRAGVESQLSTGSRFWIALPKVVPYSNDTNDASTPHSDN